MVEKDPTTQDAYGAMLIAQMKRSKKLCEIIERDDFHIDTGSVPGHYISEYRQWSLPEKQAIKHARLAVSSISAAERVDIPFIFRKKGSM